MYYDEIKRTSSVTVRGCWAD